MVWIMISLLWATSLGFGSRHMPVMTDGILCYHCPLATIIHDFSNQSRQDRTETVDGCLLSFT